MPTLTIEKCAILLSPNELLEVYLKIKNSLIQNLM